MTNERHTLPELEAEAELHGVSAEALPDGRTLRISARWASVPPARELHYEVIERVDRTKAAWLLNPPDTIAEGIEMVNALPPVPSAPLSILEVPANMTDEQIVEHFALMALAAHSFAAWPARAETAIDEVTRQFDCPESSNVSGVGYNDRDGELFVTFARSPGVYVYADVPRRLYEALRRARSVGSALDVFIKKAGYEFRKEDL